MTPPSGQQYLRTTLSEYDEYSDDVKSRLIKILVETKKIQEFAKNIEISDELKQYVMEQASFSETKYEKGWSHIFDSTSTIQILLWACVHDDSEWADFVKDDGTVTGHQDNYYATEKNYWYISDDPIKDKNSLWNVFYKPCIDFIDDEIEDYYDGGYGYDAWVYYNDDATRQNMLGAAFESDKIKYVDVEISKVDATNKKEIDGAHIKVIDQDNKSVDEWISSSTSTHVVKELEVGRTYTIRETVAPDGYVIAEETICTINSDRTVTYSGTTTSKGVLLIEDDLNTVNISKKSATDNEELPGATLTLTGDANWENVIDHFDASDEHKVSKIVDDGGNVKGIRWISTSDELIVKGLSNGVEYTLHEENAPDGYDYSEDITFTLENGEVTKTVTMIDKEIVKEEKKEDTTVEEKKTTEEEKTTEEKVTTTEETTEEDTQNIDDEDTPKDDKTVDGGTKVEKTTAKKTSSKKEDTSDIEDEDVPKAFSESSSGTPETGDMGYEGILLLQIISGIIVAFVVAGKKKLQKIKASKIKLV